jgi:hypothetical protein
VLISRPAPAFLLLSGAGFSLRVLVYQVNQKNPQAEARAT